jgi:large subunit ribosomal protein L25
MVFMASISVQLEIFKREEFALQVQPRDEKGKGPVGRLRRLTGMLPGVIYGHTQDPFCFKAEARTLERVLGQGGQNAVFLVEVAGRAQGAERAVVREIQYHKVRGDIMHVDLLRVDPEEKLRISVPIVTKGVPAGVRTGGGALQQTLTLVERECVASELPSRLEIDIADLEVGQSIHVRDLLGQEGRIITDAGVTIVSVLAPRLVVATAAETEEQTAEVPTGEAESKN